MCHVLSCSPCRLRSSAVPFLHIVPSIAFRSAPFRPRRRSSSGTLFARVSCVRAPARAGASCAGAVRAPDCAREAEGAPLPPASHGFSEMAPPGRAAPRGSGSGFRFLGDHHTTIRQMSRSYREQREKILVAVLSDRTGGVFGPLPCAMPGRLLRRAQGRLLRHTRTRSGGRGITGREAGQRFRFCLGPPVPQYAGAVWMFGHRHYPCGVRPASREERRRESAARPLCGGAPVETRGAG